MDGNVIGVVHETQIPIGSFSTFTFTFNSGTASSVDFSIENSSTNDIGNDFAIDNIIFTPQSPIVSNIARSTVSVQAVNDVPLAVDDGPVAVLPSTVTNIDVLSGAGADSDVDGDPLAVSGIVDLANPGTVIAIDALNPSVTLASGTTVTLLSDGTLDVVMAPGSAETETFDYEISDGNGGTDTATVTLLRDTDGDGVANIDDIDDDNDGILDVNEQAIAEPSGLDAYFFGAYTLSVDGTFDSSTSSNETVTINKPAGATVAAVYVMSVDQPLVAGPKF